MILFLWGTDSYLLREQLQEWIRQYRRKHKSGLNEAFFNTQSFDVGELKNRLGSVSMFGEKKLVVLENIFSNSTAKEALLKLLKGSDVAQSQDIFLVFIEYVELTGERRDDDRKLQEFQSDKFFNYLKEKAHKVEELHTPKGAALTNWILKEFQKRKTQIDKSALDFLLTHLPADLWLLSREIEKLSLYASKITLKEIKELVSEHIAPDIFKTIDALAQKNKQLALKLLHEHLQKGDSPLQILAMLVSQFRNIYMFKKFQARSRPLPKNLGLHPFVQKKALIFMRNFTLAELQKIYQSLFETDLAIKTGQLEPETALDLFVDNAF